MEGAGQRGQETESQREIPSHTKQWWGEGETHQFHITLHLRNSLTWSPNIQPEPVSFKSTKLNIYFYRFFRKITPVFIEKTEACSSPYAGDHRLLGSSSSGFLLWDTHSLGWSGQGSRMELRYPMARLFRKNVTSCSVRNVWQKCWQ